MFRTAESQALSRCVSEQLSDSFNAMPRIRIQLNTILLIVTAFAVLLAAASPFLTWAFHRSSRMDQVRYHLDHDAIRDSARILLASTGSKSIEIPEEIAATEPVSVMIYEGGLIIEYGDGHGHFGLKVTPAGLHPKDGVRVIDGVNYYEGNHE